MKRIIAIVIITVLAAFLAGCTTSSEKPAYSGLYTPVPAGPTKYPFNGPVEPMDPSQLVSEAPIGSNEAIDWASVRLGGSVAGDVSYKVFTDYPSYYKELGSYADKLSDRFNDSSFLSAFVVVVYVVVPSGGYTFTLDRAIIEDGTVNIDLSANLEPGMHTTGFEKHAIVISFSSSEYSPDLVYKIVPGAGFDGSVSE